MSPRNRVWTALGVALCCVASTCVAATEATPHPVESPVPVDSDLATATATEAAQPKRSSVVLGGHTLAYTVTPGTLTIRDDQGAPTGSLFYVAYVADHPGDTIRPVTFAFNGGPGTASFWLHLGGLGPMRLDFPNDSTPPGAPYSFKPSEDSILDRTDLVFIDMMGTGLSRPLGKAKPQEFWSLDADVDSFLRAICRYLDLNKRWNSPKFLLGESYGTLRAAGLAYALQHKGIQLNGLILLSSVLDIETGTAVDQDRYYVGYLPTYAATALYHGRLSPAPADREAFLNEVAEFARGPYLAALTRGDSLPQDERDRVAARLEHYTGLPASYWTDARLRVDDFHFRQALLRDRHELIGRIDARFVGLSGDALAGSADSDPAEPALLPSYTAVINDYLFGTLGYKTSLQYRTDIYVALGDSWDFRHRQTGQGQLSFGSVVLDLAAALRENPHLKVLQLEGLYDMATPFFAAEIGLDHLQLDPALRQNVQALRYPSGHMIYVEATSRHRLRADLARFYDDVLADTAGVSRNARESVRRQ